MSMLKEAFEAGKFGVTAEMAPPKGYDFSEQLEAAKLLNGKVHGVNVTDMQSASLKASSLGLCIALKNAGIGAPPAISLPPQSQFVCSIFVSIFRMPTESRS